MPNAAVSMPRVTLNIVTADQKVGLEENRALIFGQRTSAATAAAGLVIDVPRTSAEIDALFGPTSSAAFFARQFRKINQYTPLDVLLFADNGSGVAATGVVAFTGTATANGTYTVSVASESNHTYVVTVAIGDTAAVVAGNLLALMNLDTVKPFTAAVTTSTLTCTAVSKGTHANGWPLICTGSVAGLTVALTAWASGATDPSLTGAFDPLDNIRYQHILWPSTWSRTALKAWIDARKNVDNDVKDGRVFMYDTSDFTGVKAATLALNSSEIVVLSNEATSTATWKGPHLPEAPDLIACNFMAARARRFETDISISDIVATNEPNDQFGGMDKAALPYFNTPLLGFSQPLKGTGYSQAEQLELEDHGVTIVGANRSNTGIVMGSVVTTWLDDVAGNPDNTWKYLEWRDTHGVIREYLVLNCRKRFSQYRLTTGDTIANYAMANEAMIKAYILELCNDLSNQALVVRGQQARQYIQDNMRVSLDLGARKASIALVVPMVSQLGTILGTVKYTFNMN
jgi:phage tail sheath gpL-like